MLDRSRLPSLKRVLDAWPGELSAAILANGQLGILEQRAALATVLERYRPRLRAVLVEDSGFSCPPRFPFNMLRNLALGACVAPHVFVVDVDFVPQPMGRAYEFLAALVMNPSYIAQPRVIVVPAFEMTTQQRHVAGKRALRELVQRGEAVVFGDASGTREAWAPGHVCTKTWQWLNSSSTYRVGHCDPFYEPYVLLPRALAPAFDETFRGRGFDKVSFTYELFARGLPFSVAMGAFLLHWPHREEDAHTVRANCSDDRVLRMTQGDNERMALSRNPGESCVRGFLDRMRDTYGYVPDTPAKHRSFRRLAYARTWSCLAMQERPSPHPRTWPILART
eukprot:CAMPEP_0115868478 /NCGR_PEP_ID=MMETSP0287-20121206/21316_1 /TAXON_ID=412157 /ORGANISM="Chrysochromulina rotalis, Strain UIO044" /LENGTH=336 /DNA_ID=CAMNT_0003323139 /DNA_START=1 /DNA_END=1011 /DNA_ORIENTATION=-